MTTQTKERLLPPEGREIYIHGMLHHNLAAPVLLRAACMENIVSPRVGGTWKGEKSPSLLARKTTYSKGVE